MNFDENKISKDISIIIVSWNVEDVISKCIESIYEFSEDYDIQVIVVDNNSSDNSVGILKKYKDVLLIESKENLGFSKANNLGLKYATGKYVFYLNPDTILIENVFFTLISELENDENVGMTCPKLLNVDKSLQRILDKLKR